MSHATRTEERSGGRWRSIPRDVWTLGFVSLLMDISSEMIHSLLPVFLVSVLGASTATVGLIEGVGEGVASSTKLFSGWLSDRLRNRKLLAALGYGMAAACKPLFALAPNAGWVLIARTADRIGKGIRGAPRDALVADLVEERMRGAAYGLRQSLDTVGAFAGPLIAVALMAGFHDDFRLVMWIAVIPAIASAALITRIREPAVSTQRTPSRDGGGAGLGREFWMVVLAGSVLTLARFSEAFLILRAQQAGLPIALVPLVLVVMNLVYAVAAYPFGAISDRWGRRGLLGSGFAVLITADLLLAYAQGLTAVMLGVALWGLHLGLTQGLLAALVADSAPAARRGAAFGVYYLLSGVMLLLASVIAGVLWDRLGPGATFLGGAGLTAVGLLLAWSLLPKSPGHPSRSASS